ncbi:EamA family transporter RarD [Anoxybacteroides amylolyticum]|uniref:EamA-like transporter family protein n=1 Tax=Anoxybacteroides amylolyticum TaxID=294699 RepID=A0A160F4F9_9BACL|nr:EamA family transporter RarD [Anoxybacillus amylolyticus]ANB61317.1 eamA-like transporter family protein [Anoxybacillus amylolyticus]
MNERERKLGIFYTAAAYLMWGILPIYWKLLDNYAAAEILAHRIVWSFVFMVGLLVVTKQFSLLRAHFVEMWKQPKLAIGVLASACLISANWFIYIWAVNHDHIVEASLGYYINPLFSVALGMVVLKERLNIWQWVSFLLALCGVLVITFQYGKFPLVALSLALSFAFYGLTKKLASFEAAIGLTFETMVVMPISLVYLIIHSEPLSLSNWQTFLLVGAGPATALPLLYFAKGAKRISLTMVGFLQYLSPTLSLMLGVFLFHESFTKAHLYAFSCIWLALIVFSIAKTKRMQGWHHKIAQRNSFGAR